jgi:hypothetical protein
MPYRPRALAVLTVAGADDAPVTFPVRVRRAVLDSNDHNHADTLRISAEWRDAGVDPRLLSDATCDFYLGSADDTGRWRPGPASLRFCGIAVRVGRVAEEGSGFVAELDFQDYTRFFLKAKPFGSSGIPDYAQTLDAAWRRIVGQTPGADVLSDRLVLQGVDSYPTLGNAVAPRFAKLGKVPTKPETDAWAVWQQCVGMLGLISYVRKDQVIVTTATDYYTAGDPPRLVWGRNLLSLAESRDADRAGRGVGLTSFDPLSGTTIEALFPPLGDPRVMRNKVAAAKAGDPAAIRQAEERDYFAYPGVTKVDLLLTLAERVWEERSRQELEGTLRTAEMNVATQSGANFDLLSLGAGDVLRVEFEQKDKEALSAIPTTQGRIAYLTRRGYSEGAATVLTQNMATFATLDPSFFTKRVTTTYEGVDESGTFQIDVNYCNRIQVA